LNNEQDSDGEHPVPAPAPEPDGRKLWEWKTKYEETMPQIRCEAIILGAYLGLFGLLTIACFAFLGDFTYSTGDPLQPFLQLKRHNVLVWLVGSVGGTTFAIKWLVHSVANGLWHQDRFLWRVFVPLTGGIYALVVLALLESGLMGGQGADFESTNLSRQIVIAFLAGYFADGVSGLLTNVANAIFGKVDQK
jgi:hypothetical protein